ncbi:hypothetical protein IW261DRAFT_1558677 [Armillaria novae-zelandiae]|uniref:Uncharacterized protein n=1 Tax=Armillaria novae-zelandiae TaxID=153914 RepID=A0AA39PQ68_9AGAR|nr:hypothetical protein IW261DRAFT_1558677 [Armillaria novae-zelandiae]
MSFAESNIHPRRPIANPSDSDSLTLSRRGAHTTVVTASSSTPSTTLENGSRDIIANTSNNTPLLFSRPTEPGNASESEPIIRTKPTINCHLPDHSYFHTGTPLSPPASSSGTRRVAASPTTPTFFEERSRLWETDRRATLVQTIDPQQGSSSLPAFPVGFTLSSGHPVEKVDQHTPVPLVPGSSSRSSTSMFSSKSLRPSTPYLSSESNLVIICHAAAVDLVAPRAVASSPTSQLPGETSNASHRSSRRPPGRYEGVASDLSSSKSHNMNDPTHATKLTTSKYPSNSPTSSQSNPSPTSIYSPLLSRPPIPQTSHMPSISSYHSARKSSSSTTMSTSSSSLRTPHVRAEALPEHEFPSHPNASTFGRTASANISLLGQASTSSSRSLSLPSLSSTTTTSSRGASVPFQTPPSSFSSSTTSSPHSRKVSGDLLPNHPHDSRTKPVSSSPALDAIPHKLALDDMKRLLSKPASILSGSESDGYRSLGRSANRTGTVVSSDDDAGGGGYRSSPGRLSSQVRDRLGVTVGTTSEVDEDHSFLSLGHTLPLPTSTTIVQNNPSTDKRAKNVLKRRPSNGAKVPNPAIFPASYTEAKSKPRTGMTSRSRSLPANPLPRHPPSGDSVDTSGLTPAGAVAMAYKQQQLEERRRQQEELEKHKKSEKGVSTPLSSPSGSSTDHGTPKVSNTPEASTSRLPDHIVSSPPSPPSTPYYTVFGSTSGKVVAVGGPEDSWSEYSLGTQLANGLGSGIGHRTASVSVGKPRTSKSLSRSLSRKLSGRWRKGSMGVPDDDMEWEKIELPSVDRERELESESGRGRPNLQERRGYRRPVLDGPNTEEIHKSLRVSVDTHMRPVDEPTTPALKTPRTSASMAADSAFDPGFSTVPGSQETKSEPGSGGSKKLWKLIKRISTGGLRDKYTDSPLGSPSGSPPPVPALPKDYVSMNYGPKSMDGHGSTPQAGALSRFMQTRTSISGGRPSQSKGPAIHPPHPVPAISSHSPRGHRRSIATRSSSPGSSDVASSKFFQRTQSQRSSSSSYGDELPPPVPDTVVGQHIIPPGELYKLTNNLHIEGDDSRLRRRKSSGKIAQPSVRKSTSSPESWKPSVEEPLPTPPRTAWKPPQDSVRASPTIPEFSTSAPINAFVGRRPSASAESTPPDVGADLKTPSRPSRSLHRTSPSTSRKSSPIRKLPSVPRFSSPPPVPDPLTNPNRASTSSHATARPRSYANSLVSSPTAQFRDRATIKPAWTEQEKTDMWNDLLERSARAGGTLHLRGDDGLASDQLRFSAATVSDSEVE